MDIVIGTGKLFGFDLPENFNKPLSSKNFLDFWSRWHITLSEWFKFYLFNPALKFLVTSDARPSRSPYYGVMAYFVTFLVMGIWHGTTSIFIIYGLFLGFGVGVNKLYEVSLRKHLGKKTCKKLQGNFLYSSLARNATLAYFTVSLTCLWVDSHQLFEIISKLGMLKYVGSCLICLVSFSLLDNLRLFFDIFPTAGATIRDKFFFRQTGLALKFLFILFILIFKTTAITRFVYEAF
jgi:D-alanyl-lipoteichoic acid acyltransferase DltB (MBOAT superfamily)